MIPNEKSYILGADIGTTSVKVCLLDASNKEVVCKMVKDTVASKIPDVPKGNLQDPSKIYSALHSCMNRLPKDKMKRVLRLSICGQMHGVVLWKKGLSWRKRENPESLSDQFEIVEGMVSPLYTWQDKRCDTEFLNSLPRPNSHLKISSGYGCATLLWLHNEGILSEYDQCGTIMDFIITMITDSDETGISYQNAASFGYFNTVTRQWNTDVLSRVDNFPSDILPKVDDRDSILKYPWFDIPTGTPAARAYGDFQCSVLSTLENKAECSAVLNISTSAQMAFIVQRPFKFIPQDDDDIVEYFPYFDNEYMAVAASLTGGNALAEFIKTIQQWVLDLGLSIPQSKIWNKALSAARTIEQPNKTSLKVIPTLFGERHDPEGKASVRNIDPSNTGLGSVTRGICEGIIKNLSSMMTPETLRKEGIKNILASGAALLRNDVLREEVQRAYDIPIEFIETGDACVGASLAGLSLFSSQRKS